MPTFQDPEPTQSSLVIIPSNTLVITNVPSNHYGNAQFHHLKDRFAQFGTLSLFTPLKYFGRIFAVYDRIQDAIQAKMSLDHLVVDDTELRVYFGDATPTVTQSYLQVPKHTQLWLISPPGSPPVDWEQTQEMGPNRVVHAGDLAEALHSIVGVQEHGQKMRTILPEQVACPAINVLDWDVPSDEEGEEMGGIRIRVDEAPGMLGGLQLPKTPLPPH